MRVGAGTVMAATPVLIWTGSAQSAPAAPTQPVVGQTYTQEQAASDGMLDESVSPLSDGGSLYSYTSQFSAGSVQYPVPPQGFSPLTGSAAQLAEYGFPPRPSSGTALSEWLTAMTNYTGTPIPDLLLRADPDSHTVATSPEQGAEPQSTQQDVGAPSAASTLARAGNWAGYIASLSSPNYVATIGTAVLPSTSTYCGSGSKMPVWTGLGGAGGFAGGGNLMQEGIDYNNIDPGQIIPFYELIYNDNSHNWQTELGSSNLGVGAGNSIYMQLSYQASTETAFFYIENEFNGEASSAYKSGPDIAAYYDGTSAEWITEQFGGGGPGAVPLKNFSPIQWYGAQAELSNGNWKAINAGPNWKVYSGQSSTDITGYPGMTGSP